jgi:F0F1-type ATP synthase delta subunit
MYTTVPVYRLFEHTSSLNSLHIPESIYNADFGEMVRDREKLSSSLDSAAQKSTDLNKIFKKIFNNFKNAGQCYFMMLQKLLSLRSVDGDKIEYLQ